MQVSLEKLTQAMQKVRKFADDKKNVPGVMLDIDGDKMKVCYSDGKCAIVEIIDIVQDEAPIQGRIVTPYKRLMEIIESCQPSGVLLTSDFDIKFGEGNIMVISYAKKIRLAPKEVQEGEEPQYEEKIVSKFTQKITYARPEDNIQYGVLSRMDYNSIFEGDDADIWSKDELRDVLARTSTEKSKTIYVSKVKKEAFVLNLAHVTDIPLTSCENHTMTIHTNIAGALVDILGKTKGSNVSVYVKEDRYANIRSEDNTVGIWFEMSPASRTDVSTLDRYKAKQYSSYSMWMLRAALLNVISCAMAVDNNEKTNIVFDSDDSGNPAIKVASASGGQSIANDFTVLIEKYTDEVGDIASMKIPVSLKVLYDMLNNCNNHYISLDVAKDGEGTYLRVQDLAQDEETGNIVVKATHYTVASR